jgi:hypothetical protein
LCFGTHGESTKVIIRKKPRLLDVQKLPYDKLSTAEEESEKLLLKFLLLPLRGHGIYDKDFVSSSGSIGISVNNLDLSFEEKCLYANLDFSLNVGEKVAIVGENGCGKTTFMKLISEVEEYAYSGSVVIEGRVGFLPQHFEHVCGDELAIATLLNSLYDPEIDEFLTLPYEPFSSEWLQELNALGGHEIFKQANHIGLAIDLLKRPSKILVVVRKQKSCYAHSVS